MISLNGILLLTKQSHTRVIFCSQVFTKSRDLEISSVAFALAQTKTLVSRWRTRVMQSGVCGQYLASSEAVKLLSWADCDSLIGRWTVGSSCNEMSTSPAGLLTHGSSDVPSSQFMICCSVNSVSDETVWLSLLLRACEKSRRTLRNFTFLFPRWTDIYGRKSCCDGRPTIGIIGFNIELLVFSGKCLFLCYSYFN